MTYDTKQVMVTGLKSLVVLFLLLTTGMSGVWGQTSITSLSQITDENGNYIISGDISGGTPGVSTFNGTLEADIDPSTKMPYRITGLSVPLFTTLTGTVKNIVLEGVSISSGDNDGNTGAIACTANDAARIYNVGILSGSVGGTGDTGGLVGAISGTARVINCYSFANITSGNNVGGIVGNNKETTNSDAANLKTMVMNCMFYGDITGGTTKSPIYGGTIILNRDSKGVGNYNYFRLEAPYVQPTGITYNCALGAEDRFLQRFEFYRHLLNSHRELAGWWATGSYSSSEMLKWVFEPSQIGSATPYPILKASGRYHSVVNIDVLDVENKKSNTIGTTMATLTVKIQMGNGGAVYGPPTGAAITTQQLTLNITDKDPDHFNFNYYKVQLPYYNDVGTKNYTGNRVVTGWKIVSINGGTPGSFTTGDDAPAYNFADRNCTNKDLYGAGGSNRVFNQGAYWDVPEGVTSITIEPYWARCTYLADQNADKVYNTAMTNETNVPRVGGGQIYTNGVSTFNDQLVYTTIGNANATAALYENVNEATYKTRSVYDYAVVLVGNYHHLNNITAGTKPYTVTSVDLDGDNEPDYSFILRFNSRTQFHPVRYDFLNLIGLGMAQKSDGGTGSYNFGIMQPLGWFETTNTSLFRVTQFEYDRSNRVEAPYIVQGGVIEQWVSGQSNGVANKTTYFHVGGNVWFKEFHRGTHQDYTYQSKHPPVSVTGGDYDEFYLTGLYLGNITSYADNAECYINGGRFGTVAGAAMEGLGKANGADNTGNITWQVQNADIREFYAGGINAARPVTGNLSTTITGGHIDLFCGGPKFGDMSANKTVTTTATGCTFGTFFGAGYGGNSYSRQAPYNHNNVINFPHNNAQAGNDASWNAWLARFYKQEYSSTYGGVSTQFGYQFLPMSGNADNVARIFVEYVEFSLATTRNVTSNLTNCHITGNFYGGGSLGKVDGDVTSTLTNCEVNGSVFGSGFSASIPSVEVDSVGFRTEPYYYEQLGTYRTGVKGKTTTYTWEHGSAISVDNTNHILYTPEDLDALGTVSGDVILNITGNTLVEGKVFDGDGNVIEQTGGVFGGGDESKVTGTNKTVTVNINQTGGDATHYLNNVFGGGNKGDVASNVQVTIQGSSYVSNNVFGGGNLADVGGNVIVDMQSGIVNQNVYGGGALANTNINNVTAGYGTDSETIPSTSANTTTVNLQGGTINGIAFGGGLGSKPTLTAPEAENIPAYVYGDVMVELNPNAGDDCKLLKLHGCNNYNGTPKGDVTVHVYKTVAFDDAHKKLSTIDVEDNVVPLKNNSSFDVTTVYGGGNEASYQPVNENSVAHVIIEGCDATSIQYVYGGGNAASVPGTHVEVMNCYEIGSVFGGGNGLDKLEDGSDNPGANIGYFADGTTEYGSGNTIVQLLGGTIHSAFGGSNTKGNIRNEAKVYLDEAFDDCPLQIDEVYGGGNVALMAGDAQIELGCITYLKEIYGGAKNADFGGNIVLTITSGHFDRIFGGNNLGGNIGGTITVNIEETGCHPITIGELYGCGNQAAYTTPAGKTDPTINVKSFTSIGRIFGGGLGEDAVVTGNPTVNINEVVGVNSEETSTFAGTTRTLSDNTTVNLPVHESGKIGVIGTVFGGGNAAKVEGGTHVNIGTLPTINYVSGNDHHEMDVVGANIAGNVYGGGNQADVTGKTNVTIGR